MNISTIEDLAKFEQTSASEREWSNSSYGALEKQAALTPEAPALSFIADAEYHKRSEPLTYRQLLVSVTQMANLLHELGNAKSDVTALFLPNLIETQVALWGAQAAGVVFPVNTLLSPEHIVALLKESKAKVLITAMARPEDGWDGWDVLRPLLKDCNDLRHVLIIENDGEASSYEKNTNETFAISNLNEGLNRQPQNELVSGREFDAQDISSYFCTGGTTGKPKLAIRTQGAETINAHMFGTMLGEGLNDGRLLVGLPMFHVNAVITSLMTWVAGGEVVLAGRGYRDTAVMANFWPIVEKNKITFFSAVPTILSDLLSRPIDADVSSLQFAICGAAPLTVELFTRFEEATGLKILEGYGLTESSFGASVNPYHGERRIGSVGMRLPYEKMLCVQLDSDGNYDRDCEPGEIGTVALSGPNMFKGYSDPDLDKDLWVDRGDGLRWLNTGDLGRIDTEGYLYLVGRSKDLIIRAGHNIDPKLIEEALYAHEAVQHAAAVGRPDPRVGELPVAYVTLQPGFSVEAEELRAFAAEHISDRVAVPKAVTVLSEMPLTPVGKISKVALVEREALAIIKDAASQLDCQLSLLESEITPGGLVVRIGGASQELLGLLEPFAFNVVAE